MLTTADVLGADTIVFDLEDAVSIREKDSARILVREALDFLRIEDSESSVRINPYDSPYCMDDLRVIIPSKPDVIIIPKASVESIEAIEMEIERLEVAHEIKTKVGFVLIIETAMGLFTLKEILASSKRIEGLILGAEDLSSDLGIKRTKNNKEIEYARFSIATAARAYKIDAIDTPFTDVEDFDTLKEDTLFSKSIGFNGRLAINPRQIETIHQVFSPTEVEIEEAREILFEAEEAEKNGFGVFSYKGKMVDLPVIKRAENTMASAEKWGLLK